MGELFSEVWASIKKNKVRAALTAFGVFWGITMLIIMMGAGNGLNNGVSAGMGRWATNSMFLWTQGTSMPYKGFPRGRYFRLTNDDTKALKENIPELRYVCPRNQLGGYRGGNNVIHGLKSGAFSIYGDVPEYLLVEAKTIETGRFLNQTDLDEKRKVCVLGKRCVEMLYEEGEEPLGTYVQIQGVNFKVVGVYETQKTGNDAEEDRQSIFVPITTFQQAFNEGNNVGWYSLNAYDEYPILDVKPKIMALLRNRHSVHPEDERAFGNWSLMTEYTRMQNLFTGIKILSLVVGIFTLLAGAIGVSNIMLVVVKERTKEIGVRRAIGARPIHIISQVVLEAVLLTLFAGELGILFGVWLLEAIEIGMREFGVESEFFLKPGVDLSLVLTSFGILVMAGLFAGLLPAVRALQIKPIEALRAE
ncbi:MAG: ABC transporter permease [Schleiferiaceae bacterium]